MLYRMYEAASSPRKKCAMRQLQEEQDLATRAIDSAPGLFTRSEEVPDPRFRFFCVELGSSLRSDTPNYSAPST